MIHFTCVPERTDLKKEVFLTNLFGVLFGWVQCCSACEREVGESQHPGRPWYSPPRQVLQGQRQLRKMKVQLFNYGHASHVMSS